MSRRIHLSLACGAYDINRALINGAVQPDGIELTVLVEPSPQRHWRMGRHREYDVCEFSLASYLMMRDRGDSSVVAIPVFPHRRFRHSFAFVNARSGIRTPKDLEGRKVGLRTWQTTAGVWLRGILQDEHRLDLRAVRWFSQDEEDIPLALPPGIAHERVPEGKTVTRMLEEGELDALLYPEQPGAVARGDPRVRRLFDDPRHEEVAYFERTGIFPIMHTVVLQESVLAAHPWVAVNLLRAFRESKDRAFAAMRNPRAISLAWLQEAIEEQERVLGPDPWAYEVPRNRVALETFVRYAHEQGLIARRLPVESLFYPTTLEELPRYV